MTISKNGGMLWPPPRGSQRHYTKWEGASPTYLIKETIIMDLKITKLDDDSFALLIKANTPIGQRKWIMGAAPDKDGLKERVKALKDEADIVRGVKNS